MNDFKNLKINTTADIKVLGTGCAKCVSLEKMVISIVNEKALDAKVTKIDDIMEIMKFGIMSTPGLVINDKVVFSGKLPKSKDLEKIIIDTLK
ncbi:MAG: thioredoxin family protein [Salinivirgaceae bacterium]|nr:thioredoxin family protein [Salinivirgaceae bacterium]